jgi:hypothetical protein
MGSNSAIDSDSAVWAECESCLQPVDPAVLRAGRELLLDGGRMAAARWAEADAVKDSTSAAAAQAGEILAAARKAMAAKAARAAEVAAAEGRRWQLLAAWADRAQELDSVARQLLLQVVEDHDKLDDGLVVDQSGRGQSKHVDDALQRYLTAETSMTAVLQEQCEAVSAACDALRSAEHALRLAGAEAAATESSYSVDGNPHSAECERLTALATEERQSLSGCANRLVEVGEEAEIGHELELAFGRGGVQVNHADLT